MSIYDPTTAICVRSNSKNRMGGYGGLSATQFLFRDGVVADVIEDKQNVSCSNVEYQPFPELEGGGGPLAATAPAVQLPPGAATSSKRKSGT